MEDFIMNYGIWATALLLFIDDLGIPLPGTTIIFSSALIASQTQALPIYEVFLVALVIPPISNTLLFYFGRHGLRKWLGKHGHKILLPNKRIKKAEKTFEKYGEKAVFFAAMITSVRAVSSIIAGSLKMNPFKFFIYHFAGVFLWATTIVGVGYYLGDQIWDILQNQWKIFILLALIIIGGKMFWGFLDQKEKT